MAAENPITVMNAADLLAEVIGSPIVAEDNQNLTATLREYQTPMTGVSLLDLASYGMFRVGGLASNQARQPVAQQELQDTIRFVLDLVADEVP